MFFSARAGRRRGGSAPRAICPRAACASRGNGCAGGTARRPRHRARSHVAHAVRLELLARVPRGARGSRAPRRGPHGSAARSRARRAEAVARAGSGGGRCGRTPRSAGGARARRRCPTRPAHGSHRVHYLRPEGGEGGERPQDGQRDAHARITREGQRGDAHHSGRPVLGHGRVGGEEQALVAFLFETPERVAQTVGDPVDLRKEHFRQQRDLHARRAYDGADAGGCRAPHGWRTKARSRRGVPVLLRPRAGLDADAADRRVDFLPSQNSVALWQQAKASKKSSRLSPRRQFVPDGACAGQISTQAEQVPHFDSLKGWPVSNGASVRTVVSRIAEPKGFVITRAFFPIQPSPERVAAILWDSPARRRTASNSSVVGSRAMAAYPRSCKSAAARCESSESRALARRYSRKYSIVGPFVIRETTAGLRATAMESAPAMSLRSSGGTAVMSAKPT